MDEYIIADGASIRGMAYSQATGVTSSLDYTLHGQMVFTKDQLEYIDENKRGKVYVFKNDNCGYTTYVIHGSDVTETADEIATAVDSGLNIDGMSN